MLLIHSIYGNEKGAVLVVALAFMVVLGLLGTTAVLITTTDMKIGGNYKTSQQAFYEADAGVEEARARMRGDAETEIYIDDDDESNVDWKSYIGDVADPRLEEIGYDDTDTDHHLDASLSVSDFDYVVEIEHSTDPSSGLILKWADTDGDGLAQRNTAAGETIYLVTSYGSEGGSNDTVQIEITRLPPITAPGALYVEAVTTLLGTSTNINGTDACGSDDAPGIVSTLPDGADPPNVNESGNPHIEGVNSEGYPDGPSDIVYDGTNMEVQQMVDLLSSSADFRYSHDTNVTQTASAIPGPGDDWGSPVQADSTPPLDLSLPSTCSESNIIYYDMIDDEDGTHELGLKGGVQGCGVLVIDGNLDVNGGFFWYGVIIVSGSIKFTGGGGKNVTGAVIAGGSAIADTDVIGGNANIVYCSTAINSLLQNKAFRRLSWKEEM